MILMAGVTFTEPDVDVDADAVLMLMQNYCQEPPLGGCPQEPQRTDELLQNCY